MTTEGRGKKRPGEDCSEEPASKRHQLDGSISCDRNSSGPALPPASIVPAREGPSFKSGASDALDYVGMYGDGAKPPPSGKQQNSAFDVQHLEAIGEEDEDLA